MGATRCRDAPVMVAPIADKSPARASLVTGCTPDRQWVVNDRRKVDQPAPSWAVLTSTPRISR